MASRAIKPFYAHLAVVYPIHTCCVDVCSVMYDQTGENDSHRFIH